VQDRDNKISDLLTQIDSLKRKAEQSSQQSQGETLEVALKHQLRSQFPFDLIEPVAKGEFGGNVLQHVRDRLGNKTDQSLVRFMARQAQGRPEDSACGPCCDRVPNDAQRRRSL